MLPEHYDVVLVALSCVVAALGSYLALDMAPSVTARSGRFRMSWLLGSAGVQGTAIWGMHFTGMLAFRLPVPIRYDVALVALSWLIASVGSLLSLVLTHRRPWGGAAGLALGGVAIGAGISGLHYIDMAAMRMAAHTHYRPSLVIASILIAVVFGQLSLWLARQHRFDTPRRSRLGKLLGAAVMGAAIVGQHYTGMAAADFSAAAQVVALSAAPAIPAEKLPQAVLIATLAILLVTLLQNSADRSRRAQAGVSQRLLEARESERRRIARGVHEDLGQLLTALRINLQRLSPAPADAPVLEDSVTLVDATIAGLRELSVELRPAVLDDLGLAAAARWHATRHAERAGIALTIDEDLGGERLPEAVETAGFRILQQALTNIIRHAQARRVHIALHRKGAMLDLSIRDDGIGFDVSAARRRAEAGESLGLLDMQELATLVEGTLRITSAAGAGTTVLVRFPLTR